MKKLSRREQTLLRMVFLVVGVWLFLEIWETYDAHKMDMQTDIDSLRGKTASVTKSLAGESIAKYQNGVKAIVEDLEDARSRVLELPREADASLLIRSTLDRKAESSGLNINSISSRRPKTIEEATGLIELPTYIGYDTDLQALLEFFGSFQEQEYFLAIDSLNISSRTPMRRSRRGRPSATERSPLTGNAVLLTLFRPNPDASIDQYQQPSGESAGDRLDFPSDRADAGDEPTEPVADMASDGSDPAQDPTPQRRPNRDDRNGDGVPDNPRDRIARGLDRERNDDDEKPANDLRLPDVLRPTKPVRRNQDPPRDASDKPASKPSNNTGNSLVPIPSDDDQRNEKPAPRKPTELSRPPKPLTGSATIKKNKAS